MKNTTKRTIFFRIVGLGLFAAGLFMAGYTYGGMDRDNVWRLRLRDAAETAVVEPHQGTGLLIELYAQAEEER